MEYLPLCLLRRVPSNSIRGPTMSVSCPRRQPWPRRSFMIAKMHTCINKRLTFLGQSSAFTGNHGQAWRAPPRRRYKFSRELTLTIGRRLRGAACRPPPPATADKSTTMRCSDRQRLYGRVYAERNYVTRKPYARISF